MIVFDSDDFGCNHVISDMCQSHDCRDMLMLFKEANPNFKATLFAIPGEMTAELLKWSEANSSWIELAYHGFFHTSNYECEKLTYEQFDELMHSSVTHRVMQYFVKGFKAPGWQISDDIYRWLGDHGYWVADQAYNDERRPLALPAYVNDEGRFYAHRVLGEEEEVIEFDRSGIIDAIHTHTWDCVGNGVYELKDQILERIKGETDFKFVSEVVQ